MDETSSRHVAPESLDDLATKESVEEWAAVVNETARAMNHLTLAGGGKGIPAPVACVVLRTLSDMAYMLPELVEQLAEGLTTSLDHYEVYDQLQDPSLSVKSAGQRLDIAATHALRLAEALSAAQVNISLQDCNAKKPTQPPVKPDDAT